MPAAHRHGEGWGGQDHDRVGARPAAFTRRRPGGGRRGRGTRRAGPGYGASGRRRTGTAAAHPHGPGRGRPDRPAGVPIGLPAALSLEVRGRPAATRTPGRLRHPDRPRTTGYPVDRPGHPPHRDPSRDRRPGAGRAPVRADRVVPRRRRRAGRTDRRKPDRRSGRLGDGRPARPHLPHPCGHPAGGVAGHRGPRDRPSDPRLGPRAGHDGGEPGASCSCGARDLSGGTRGHRARAVGDAHRGPAGRGRPSQGTDRLGGTAGPPDEARPRPGSRQRPHRPRPEPDRGPLGVTVTSLDLNALLLRPELRLLLCVGTGGVGKTTLSAALAVRAAMLGRRVVVVTIDPARRLAQAMGLDGLAHEPTPVALAGAAGSLDAMMLDVLHSFDQALTAQVPPEEADRIRVNPFYKALAESFSGTQEYVAMEKIGELHRQADATGRWDLIVVDTPPSASALDFLDGPNRLEALARNPLLRVVLGLPKGPF